MYAIETGAISNTDVARGIRAFAQDKLNTNDKARMRNLYKMIIECMANTRNHAYTRFKGLHKWWLMASFDQRSKSVGFTFIDNGHGIPSTVRKKLLGDIAAADHKLIASAMSGELRTSTRLSYRGKGLPSLLRSLRSGAIQDLSVLSMRGFVNCTTMQGRKTSEQFQGTMITWKMVAVDSDAV